MVNRSVSSLFPLAGGLSEEKKKRHLSPQTEVQAAKRATVYLSDYSNETYCYECGISFSRPYTLRRHNRDKHDGHLVWRCDLDGCGKAFKRKDIRDRHIDTQHGHGKVICPTCSSFVRKDGLSEHLASKACRAVRNRKSCTSQLFQDCTNPILAFDEVHNHEYPTTDCVPQNQLDHDQDENALHANSMAAPLPVATAYGLSELAAPEMFELAGNEELGQISQAHSIVAKAPTDDHVTSTALAAHYGLHNLAPLSTPDFVADSPRPIVAEDTLSELFLVDNASVIELAEDVEEKFLALEKSVAIANNSQHHFQPRSDASSPLTAVRAHLSYDMRLGSRCALCGDRLGHNLKDIIDHAKSHIDSRNRPTLECKHCKIKFAFHFDLRLHLNKLQTWSLSREFPPVDNHDPSDWVAKACFEAREAFIDLLRSWETLQLHWYLTAINKLVEKNKQLQARYRSDVPRFLRRSLQILGFRHSDFTAATNYDERHISMNTLIQKFSRTSLMADTEPPAPSYKKDLSHDEDSTIEDPPESCSSKLYCAAKGAADHFEQTLGEFRTNCSDENKCQSTLEGLLHRACWEGELLIVQRLLNAGVDIESVSSHGVNALGCALLSRNSNVATYLLERGAMTARHYLKTDSALHHACHVNLLDLIPKILQDGADMDEKGSRGCTPLMLAANAGNLEIAKMLLEAGASLDRVSDSVHRTALYYAVARGHYELVRLLLAHNAPTDQQDISGDTALMAATSAGYVSIVKLLLEHGADIFICDQFGKDALQLADLHRHDRVRELLVNDYKRSGVQKVLMT